MVKRYITKHIVVEHINHQDRLRRGPVDRLLVSSAGCDKVHDRALWHVATLGLWCFRPPKSWVEHVATRGSWRFFWGDLPCKTVGRHLLYHWGKSEKKLPSIIFLAKNPSETLANKWNKSLGIIFSIVSQDVNARNLRLAGPSRGSVGHFWRLGLGFRPGITGKPTENLATEIVYTPVI